MCAGSFLSMEAGEGLSGERENARVEKRGSIVADELVVREETKELAGVRIVKERWRKK